MTSTKPRLSGWVRIWLVALVPIWVLGAWWLMEHPVLRTHLNDPTFNCLDERARGSNIFPAACERGGAGPSCEELQRAYELCIEVAVRSGEMDRFNEMAERANRDHEIRTWLRIGFVATLPLLLAFIFMLGRGLVRWIARGFKALT